MIATAIRTIICRIQRWYFIRGLCRLFTWRAISTAADEGSNAIRHDVAGQTTGVFDIKIISSVIFHRIWFGDNPIPTQYEQYWAAWQRQYPDCLFRTWTDNEIAELKISKAKILEAKTMAGKADIARYEIMYTYGGIYIDCDMMPLTWFNPIEVVQNLVVCNEDASDEYCSIGFIGAPAKHPLFLDILNHINAINLNKLPPNEETGPFLFGKYLKSYGHEKLPTRTFYPYLYDEPFSILIKRDLSATWGIHVWGGSWLSNAEIKKKATKIIGRGDLQEAMSLISTRQLEEAEDLVKLIADLAKIRRDIIAFQKNHDLNDMLILDDTSPFELLKVLLYVLQRNDNALIWQVGAGDGILVDPIRAALINFDPHCILLEPNPYLYKKLVSSYANNFKAILLNKALGEETQKIAMNCINPEKAGALGLPHWVNGISSFYDDKNAIGGKTIDLELTREISTCIDKIEVNVISLSDIIYFSGGRTADVFIIDAEGMDFIIIKSALAKGIQPNVIHFEYQCMNDIEIREVIELLNKEYVLIKFGNDYTAYKKTLFYEYAEQLFILNGLPTIYKNILSHIGQV